MSESRDQPFLTRKAAAALAVAATGWYIVLIPAFGNRERGAAAAWFTITIILAGKVYWTLHHHPWFWMAVAVLVAVHMSLVILVPWPAMHLSGQGFLPIAFLDVFANCGYFALGARIMKVSTSD